VGGCLAFQAMKWVGMGVNAPKCPVLSLAGKALYAQDGKQFTAAQDNRNTGFGGGVLVQGTLQYRILSSRSCF
jgi:hypothetical protein